MKHPRDRLRRVMSDTARLKECLMRAPTRTARSALLVDDDGFMLEFVSDLLHDLGVSEVITANDGKKGMAAFDLARIKPDVVLIDTCLSRTGFR